MSSYFGAYVFLILFSDEEDCQRTSDNSIGIVNDV
jgi:hypothetical protein